MLVDRGLVQLSVHQLSDDDLCVTVLLKAEITAVGEAALYRGTGKHVSCSNLMHHDAAMAFCVNRENAFAKRSAALDLSPGGIARLYHFLCVQYVLDLCNPFCRTFHQIFLCAEQVAKVMPPVIAVIETSPGDIIVGDMLADTKTNSASPT